MTARPRLRRAVAALALLLAVATGGLALGLATPGVAPADADGVEARTASAIDEILADPALPAAVWGIVAVDTQTGRTIVSRGANTLLMPASTLKLFTTATALDALGPDYRFTTQLYHFGPTGSTLRGDLVIRGGADPTFGSSELDNLPDPLARWAQSLYDAGVRRIEGRIIGDDDRTDDTAYGEGWDVSHIGVESYAPASGGIVWADNVLPVRLRGGSTPTVDAGPPGFATVRRAVSEQSGRSRINVRRALGSDDLTLSGTAAPGYEGTIRIPVANPTRYALHAFAQRLTRAGIDVSDATLWDVDDLSEKPDYEGQDPLLVAVSPPLSRIIIHTNKESDNLYAEHILRALTGSGSVDAGTNRVRSFLSSAGADVENLSLRDGSGLSRKDLITPASMVALLRRMQNHPAGAVFRASLPEGGGAGSTLRNRLAGVPVRAKTGSIEYARCLSGYVTGPNGQTIAFSLMVNNYTVDGSRIAGAQDAIVRALATGQRPDVTPAPEE